MLKWTSTSESVETFFTLIGDPFRKGNKKLLDSKIYLNLSERKKVPEIIVNTINKKQEQFV